MWQIYDRAHHDELRARTGADAGMLLSLPEKVGSVLRSPEELSAVEAAQKWRSCAGSCDRAGEKEDFVPTFQSRREQRHLSSHVGPAFWAAFACMFRFFWQRKSERICR